MALARAWKQISWFYYQYLLVTALYMLEPWERTVFNVTIKPVPESVNKTAILNDGKHNLRECSTQYIGAISDSMLVSIMGMALYTGYVFMPQHIMAILHYFEIVQ